MKKFKVVYEFDQNIEFTQFEAKTMDQAQRIIYKYRLPVPYIIYQIF